VHAQVARRFLAEGLTPVVEVERWDAPLLHLPGREDLLDVTKRGALVYARRR
jgi:hypothetical protein